MIKNGFLRLNGDEVAQLVEAHIRRAGGSTPPPAKRTSPTGATTTACRTPKGACTSWEPTRCGSSNGRETGSGLPTSS